MYSVRVGYKVIYHGHAQYSLVYNVCGFVCCTECGFCTSFFLNNYSEDEVCFANFSKFFTKFCVLVKYPGKN